MNTIDYYAVLQVPQNATLNDIRNSYHRLAFLYHPDITKNPASIPLMQLLNEAYSVLGSPVKRAQYDFWRKYNGQPNNNAIVRRERSAAVPYPRIGPYQTSSYRIPIRDTAPRLVLFFGQILYLMCYFSLFVILILFATIIPYTISFLIVGQISLWLAPINPLSSDDTLVVVLFSSGALMYGLIWTFKKVPVLRKLYHMLKM